MLTLVNFVATLIVSWIIVYAIYGLTILAVRSVWWTVRVISGFTHAKAGAALVVVYPVWWMVRMVARLGETRAQSSHDEDNIVAPVVPGTVGNRDVLTPTPRPTLPDVAVSIREAT